MALAPPPKKKAQKSTRHFFFFYYSSIDWHLWGFMLFGKNSFRAHPRTSQREVQYYSWTHPEVISCYQKTNDSSNLLWIEIQIDKWEKSQHNQTEKIVYMGGA
jgi:hypothetical protein